MKIPLHRDAIFGSRWTDLLELYLPIFAKQNTGVFRMQTIKQRVGRGYVAYCKKKEGSNPELFSASGTAGAGCCVHAVKHVCSTWREGSTCTGPVPVGAGP